MRLLSAVAARKFKDAAVREVLDGQVVSVSAGQTVKCPAGEEHWHGATDTTLMAHIALVVGNGNGDGTTWLEPVTDEQYAAAVNH